MSSNRIQSICGRRFVVVLVSRLLFLILGEINVEAQVLWQQTNGPLGGIIYAFAINRNGEVFAGGDGGVFRSTDAGNSWITVNTGLMNSRVQALVINASGHIFAGTPSLGVPRITATTGRRLVKN